jgi:nicotinamidase-related amidase
MSRAALVVIDAQQEDFAPGSPTLAVHPEAAPRVGEPVFQKHLPGSFTGTRLEESLRAHLGFQVTVLSDAGAASAVTGPDGRAIPAVQALTRG